MAEVGRRADLARTSNLLLGSLSRRIISCHAPLAGFHTVVGLGAAHRPTACGESRVAVGEAAPRSNADDHDQSFVPTGTFGAIALTDPLFSFSCAARRPGEHPCAEGRERGRERSSLAALR